MLTFCDRAKKPCCTLPSNHCKSQRSAVEIEQVLARLQSTSRHSVAVMGQGQQETDKAVAIAKTLHSQGILTKLRNSAGQDVDGGCGQLRARSLKAEAAAEAPLRFEPRRALK